MLANAEENRLPDLDALREASFALCVGGWMLPAVVLAERIGLTEGRYSAGRRTYPGSHVRP